MVNKFYQKGYRKERAIVNEARAKGLISGRMAGSHTIFDVFIIDYPNRKIYFIQSKKKKLSKAEEVKFQKLKEMNDEYYVEFKLISERSDLRRKNKNDT